MSVIRRSNRKPSPCLRRAGAARGVLLAVAWVGSSLVLPGASPRAAPQAPQRVLVVAAADLQYALRDIAAAFAAAHPQVRVQLSFGSSGKFFMQLTQGLEADLFFSADSEFPARLEQAGLVEPGLRRLYAVGRMVIWARNELLAAKAAAAGARFGAARGQQLPSGDGVSPDPAFLTDPGVLRVAIANPVHAPYGRAALTLLEHYGLARRTTDQPWEKMQGALDAHFDFSPLRAGKPSFEFVLGENISHAAQLALRGTGVGILALSVARAQAMQVAGRYWLAPLESHLRLEQGYAVLRGRARPEVLAFYAFIGSPPAREIFRRYGFLLPDERGEGEAGAP